jgi:hypothetical protein
MDPNQNWEIPTEVMIFDHPQEYFKVSGAESWSGGSSFIVFDLDIDSLPSLVERMIMVLFKDFKEVETVLAHEIAHLVFRDLLGISASIPTWISEGFATHVFSDQMAHASEPIPLESLTQFQEYPPFERAFYEQSSQLVLSEVYRGDFKSIQEFVDHLNKERKENVR